MIRDGIAGRDRFDWNIYNQAVQPTEPSVRDFAVKAGPGLCTGTRDARGTPGPRSG